MMKILLSIMFIYSISFSQSKIGTSAVPFLGIGIGAKSLGMAGAYSAMSGKSESWYWNPSAVVLSTGLNTHVHSANWLVDTKISSFSISNSLNNSLVVGGYLNYLDYGKEIVTTLDEEFGTGDYWTASDFVIGTGISWKITNRFSMGTVGKLIRSKIYNETASTFALDLGLLYVSTHELIQFGANISNLGPNMILDGKDLYKKIDIDPDVQGHNETILARLKTDEWPLPIIFRIGLVGNLNYKNIADIKVSSDAVIPSDDQEHLNIGTEIKILNMLVARAGFRHIGKDNTEEGLTVGFGFEIPLYRKRIELNYAYQQIGVFGFVPHFEINYKN